MPDTKKYLDIDGLTEYHESAGHSADIADGSITTAKLAQYAVTSAKLYTSAVTSDKLAPEAVTGSKIHPDSVNTTHIVADAIQTYNILDGAVTYSKITPSAISHIQTISLIAVDSQTAQALNALDVPNRTLTPKQMLENSEQRNSTNRLCWIKDTFIEVADIIFFGDLQSRQITLYARGVHSVAYGKLGVDTSWTIE